MRAVVAGAWLLLILLVRVALTRWITRAVSDQTSRYRLRKAVATLLFIAVGMVAVNAFDADLSGLAVAFGVAGAGIAFALQEVIVSCAGWIAVTFGGFYKAGDRVMLGGIRGDVIDIGVLRTTLFEIGEWVSGDLYNGRVVRVANSFVFKEPVFNYSADFPFVWDEIKVPVRHGSNRPRAHAILTAVANELAADYTAKVRETWEHLTKKYMIEEATIDPVVFMTADENWMTYTVRYVVDYKRRRSCKNGFFERVLAEFDATQGEVSIASTAQEVTLFDRRREARALTPH